MSAIKVGDLVAVVRCCCETAAQQELGLMRTVLEIRAGESDVGLMRPGCNCVHGVDQPMARIEGPTGFHVLAWLKRIPPLSELESEDHKEELTA
jgi:hypothetical protein